MADTQQLSADDHARISAAVHAAEAHTSGEIVTIIADQSDDYADVALCWAAGLAALSLVILCIFPHIYLPQVDRVLGRWAFDWTPRAVLELALFTATLKFSVSWLILLWRPLRLWLVPGRVRTARVHKRAISFFKVGAERRTQGRTGVLLYLSLAEHRAEIVADQAIHSRVAQEEWGQAMADLVVHVREGRIADGMIAAVGDIGAVLSAQLPRLTDDANELPDRLIEL